MEPSDMDSPIDGPDWKRSLLAACAEAIAQLPDDAPPTPSLRRAEDPPSLYSFFEEMAILRNEMRKGNRRTAETFSKFGEILETMREDSGKLRERLANPATAETSQVNPRKFALNLVDFVDRTGRLESAARAQAVGGWLSRLRSAGAWVQQAEALSILRDHLQQLLSESGIARIDAAPGKPFDPHLMRAVGRDASGGSDRTTMIVSEELLPGYRLADQCLRPAEVRVTTANTDE